MLVRFLVSLSLIAFPTLLSALNGMYPLGYGVRSNGMGGVGVAYAQDAFASALNPAGLNYVRQRGDFGFGWLFQKGETTHRITGSQFAPAYHSDQGIWLPEAAVTWSPLRCHMVGIAIYPNCALITNYSTPLPGFGTSPAKSLFYELYITPSWSWRINCVHSVGVAVNIAVGWLEVNGLEDFRPNSVFPNFVTNQGLDTNEGVSLRFGWLGEFIDCFKVGITFQTKTWCSAFKRYQGLLPNQGHVSLAPETAIGFSWYLLPCVNIAGDVLFRIWNGCPTFANNIRQSGTWGGSLGRSFGPGLGWQNQVVLKAGVDWEVYPWLTLRVGYNYSADPITPSDTASNQWTLATLDNHVTIGATYSLCYAEFSFYYVHAFDRKVSGIISSDLIGVTEIDLRNRQDAFGITYTRFF